VRLERLGRWEGHCESQGTFREDAGLAAAAAAAVGVGTERTTAAPLALQPLQRLELVRRCGGCCCGGGRRDVVGWGSFSRQARACGLEEEMSDFAAKPGFNSKAT
jgi:hypothetical protein